MFDVDWLAMVGLRALVGLGEMGGLIYEALCCGTGGLLYFIS